MEHFTPVSALIGGALIGLAAAVLWLGIGRIAGISGIVGNLWTPGSQPQRADVSWRIAFLIGLVAAPMLFGLAGGTLPPIQLPSSPVLIVSAGLLVGIGTRLGSGCTSGHGVCGLARLSRRSLVATAIFMATAILTVFVTRHLTGL
ncbi:MAG: YeeE/YedE family protein [Rhizobiaceae bacterium]